jgi:hypothetical protein
VTDAHDIQRAIAEADRVLAGGAPSAYPRQLFPELARHERRRAATPTTATQPLVSRPVANARQARPVTPAAEGEMTPETVAGWSAELGFSVPAKQGRIVRCGD